jgi:hypothetical protein
MNPFINQEKRAFNFTHYHKSIRELFSNKISITVTFQFFLFVIVLEIFELVINVFMISVLPGYICKYVSGLKGYFLSGSAPRLRYLIFLQNVTYKCLK